ncbi:MAG: hypothetical protein J5I94_02345 [Phaeodactylibacter sp.]|nr:hypothetical protein [Phaeodactylibacter sp.]
MKTVMKAIPAKKQSDKKAEAAAGPAPVANLPINKIGAPAIFDAYTGSYITLPQGYRISQSNGKTWIGSSADGQAFLLVERFPSAEQTIPTILAEGDLGLFLVSTRPAIERISSDIAGIEARGELDGKDIRAYLARVTVDDKLGYLVLVACEAASEKIAVLREAALEIAQRFVR